MLQILETWLAALSPLSALSLGCLGLLFATQVVIWVLSKLEKHKFGSVQLGVLITPLCTGFPNLMIGLFGQTRLQGDLIIQLNIGNNIANTSLVTGLLLLVAGPLLIRPSKGRSKKAKRENRAFASTLFFLWIGAILLLWMCRDGQITRLDGLGLVGLYAVSQLFSLRERGKVSKKQKLSFRDLSLIFLGLAIAAIMIQQSVALVSQGLQTFGESINMQQLGLLMGLLTVFPESFLMLRLALRKGNLGISGLVGDCLVSIPLVIGLSSLLTPISTAAFQSWSSSALIPFYSLFATMIFFTTLAMKKKPVARSTGLFFILVYACIWWTNLSP